MAKKIVIILLISLGAINPVLSQSQEGYTKKYAFYVETGYFIPSKESFRTNYDQGLFLGTVNIPVSLGIGMQYFISRSKCLYFDFRRVKNLLVSSEDVSITIMPMVVGLYYYPLEENHAPNDFKPYCGIGLGLCWTQFSTEYYITDEASPERLGTKEESQHYFGPNLKLTLGMDYQCGNATSFGIALNYDVNHEGAKNEGGLGNVGGFLISAKFTFFF